jgi:hypothetical protein
MNPAQKRNAGVVLGPRDSGQPRCPTDNQTYSSSVVTGPDRAVGPCMACKASGLGSALPCPADRSVPGRGGPERQRRPDQTGPEDAAPPRSRLPNDAVVTEDEPTLRSSWEPTALPCARSASPAVPLACQSQQSWSVPADNHGQCHGCLNLRRFLPSQVAVAPDLALGGGGRMVL